jgi:hypothetical protein
MNEPNKVYDGVTSFNKENYITIEYIRIKKRARALHEGVQNSGYLSRIYDESENEQYTWDLIEGFKGNQEAALDSTEDLEIW